MNDMLKIISVIGAECIITLFLLVHCRFRVIPHYLQTMLAFFLGGIGVSYPTKDANTFKASWYILIM